MRNRLSKGIRREATNVAVTRSVAPVTRFVSASNFAVSNCRLLDDTRKLVTFVLRAISRAKGKQ
jgi:hypothetical protein